MTNFLYIFKLTEYILIGTLVSFGIAILIGKIYLKLENLL